MTDQHAAELPKKLPESVYRNFAAIDRLPAEVRACVHDLGWEPVSVMLTHNLKPSVMRSIVHACWCAPMSPHQRQGFDRPRDERSSSVLQHLDALLSRAGAEISGTMLVSFLKMHNMVIVPIDVNEPMIKASLETVSNHDVTVTKREKHRRRIQSAISAAAARLWPHAFATQHGRNAQS